MIYRDTKNRLEYGRPATIDGASDALANTSLKLLASTHVNSELKKSYAKISSILEEGANEKSEHNAKSLCRKIETRQEAAIHSEEWITRFFIAGTAMLGIVYISIYAESKKNGLFIGLVCLVISLTLLGKIELRKLFIAYGIKLTKSPQYSKRTKTKILPSTIMRRQESGSVGRYIHTARFIKSSRHRRVGWHELLRRNRNSEYFAR